MATQELTDDPRALLSRLSQFMDKERYGRGTQQYVGMAKRFIEHLHSEGLTVRNIKPFHVDQYIASMCRQRKSHMRTDLSDGTRAATRSAIHLLLRLTHGLWPQPVAPQSELDTFHQNIIRDYDGWMERLRGLSVDTRSARRADATRFLKWLGTRATQEGLRQLVVADIDQFVRWRAKSLRRSTIKLMTINLRSFLRHLFYSGFAPDVASTVVGPRIYTFEDIPSALQADEVEKVVQFVRKDRSPVGLRDYAILMLLTTYGVRAGEITALRLDDIDWHHGRLRIHHSKTGVHSELPLLTVPGEAILDYLRDGRPKTTVREVFLRATAPYRGLKSGSSLYSHLGDRLQGAGVRPLGRKGPHAFRHARAVGLLKSAVPLKVIGDVLGHRSAQSTLTYLKLDVNALRGVALDIPGVRP